MKILITLFIFFSTNSFATSNYKEMVSFVKKSIDLMQKIPYDRKSKLSHEITKNAIRYNVDPRIMVAIINVESNFKKDAYNPSGDYSLVQINYNIWKKEFKNRNLRPLIKKDLVTNEAYAIDRMAEILSLLKKQYSKKDKLWYLMYHSSTPKYKNRYLAKLKKEIKKIIQLSQNNLF